MPSKDEREFHRKVAARCFNGAWDYLDKTARTKEDDQAMLQLAHASRYHWGLVGTPRNAAVGDWQISRVYAALKQAHLSLLFANSSLETCKKEKLADLLATAYEAVARAYAAAEDYALARKYLEMAKSQLESQDLEDVDRKVYLAQIHETEKLIPR